MAGGASAHVRVSDTFSLALSFVCPTKWQQRLQWTNQWTAQKKRTMTKCQIHVRQCRENPANTMFADIFGVPPDVGLAPTGDRRPPPPPPPCTLGPHPPHQPGPPPGALQKEPRGVGEEGRRGRGGKRFGLREGSSNYNGGWGGDPPNTSWGQTHIWGLPNFIGADFWALFSEKKRVFSEKGGGVQ